MNKSFDVFLSHNSKDKPLVRRIAERLAEFGLNPWLDEKDLRPGFPFQDGLEEAMRTTRAAAVFIGGHGLGSWQRPEVRACLSQMVERSQPVIPVLLPGAPEKPEIGLFLRENTWIDLRDGITEEGISRLVWGITGEKPARDSRTRLSAPPEPRYENDRTRELGSQLAEAQRRFKELSIAGRDVADVREQILGLRRALREGGRLQVGEWLGEGRFQLLEIVGRGGFATVWKAWDEERQALVAVKVLHGQHADDRTRRERFFRGARKMAELHHPGVVRVIEAELEENGKYFFVMDYVEGGDLRRAVLARELPQERVLPIILAVGEVLTYAHEKGIIHRDVKPANILLDGGQPKLTDFDLVRTFDTTGGTQTQGMLGTVLFSAPEMLNAAKDASATADVYSLAMTTVFAFHGNDLPPDVWRFPEDFLRRLPCPPALQEVFACGISWEPEDRPASVALFCKELRLAAAAPLGIKRRRRSTPDPIELKQVETAKYDTSHLTRNGWGVVFPHRVDPRIRAALAPLIEHRKRQMTPFTARRFRELDYRPRESNRTFLGRFRVAPSGAADPDDLPYYLLLVGSPEEIPWSFQHQLAMKYAVGRLCFDTPEEYARYAETVIAAETGQIVRPRRLVLFGTRHSRPTEMMADYLIAPLNSALSSSYPVETILADEATKERLGRLLGGDETPALLFTAQHGMGFPAGDPRQLAHQGALLCQAFMDGRGPVGPDVYLSGDDVGDGARPAGLVAFFYACHGLGTPQYDSYPQHARSVMAASSEAPRLLAPQPFVAHLPRRLLGHPAGGALAVIGHVERTWGYSFLWQGVGSQTQVFEKCLRLLLDGYPVGTAFEPFTLRLGQLASELAALLGADEPVDAQELARLWTAHNDARAYALLGDPAVRLPIQR